MSLNVFVVTVLKSHLLIAISGSSRGDFFGQLLLFGFSQFFSIFIFLVIFLSELRT